MFLWIEILLAFSVVGFLLSFITYLYFKGALSKTNSASENDHFITAQDLKDSKEASLKAISDHIENLMDVHAIKDEVNPDSPKLKSLQKAFDDAYHAKRKEAGKS